MNVHRGTVTSAIVTDNLFFCTLCRLGEGHSLCPWECRLSVGKPFLRRSWNYCRLVTRASWWCFRQCTLSSNQTPYQTIWSFPLTNIKWHSVTWPYTMTTPYWSDFLPNSTFYRILRGFHRTFATGVACRQETLTPPDTWSRIIGTCICSTFWDQSFSRTCRYFSGQCSSNIPRYFLDFTLYFTVFTLNGSASIFYKSHLA